ncbi:probably inactive leucine-rich repeat receptor-like protein kinase At5g48380, partial [Miscanthus floridulus]|uniref:probably inactive leucine-rich repeat receptor-like protein kinase At5g48380 n=1 Tax=Miscanthus floridulus TaxID=154761 RepID=UPI003458882C
MTAPGEASVEARSRPLRCARSAVATSLVPPYSCLASWDFARDPCAAFPCGLRCYTAAGATNSSYLRVTAIALDPTGYSGAHPAFHGKLPAGVPLPPSLRILDLSGTAFSGAIPGSLFTASSALQELYLSRNGFSGGVPPQLALLGALTRLELQHNAL